MPFNPPFNAAALGKLTFSPDPREAPLIQLEIAPGPAARGGQFFLELASALAGGHTARPACLARLGGGVLASGPAQGVLWRRLGRRAKGEGRGRHA